MKGKPNKISLTKTSWSYDPATLLGEGGLGLVFAGVGHQGEPIAIKQINYTAPNVANRETLMAEFLAQGAYQHILPILDAGIDPNTDRCYIVMPRADYSLKTYLSDNGPLSETNALAILRQIAAGLAEIPTIVHRDLKPANILFHANVWKIADFGIARFAEQVTASQTIKDHFSPQYAAPEQWRNQHATTATDIYALGCIAYELFAGQAPFPGPSEADYADQHSQTPPPLLPATISASFREVVSLMLHKSMGSRPDLARLIKRIDHCINNQHSNSQPHQQGRHALASIGAQIAEEEAQKEAYNAQQKAEQKRHIELASTATMLLNQLLFTLEKYLAAESVYLKTSIEKSHSGYVDTLNAKLGDTILWVYQSVFRITKANRNSSSVHGSLILSNSFAQSQWNVIAGAIIRIQKQDVSIGANFWYMTRNNPLSYRWYEVGYDGRFPFLKLNHAPTHLEDLHDADLAASNIISKYSMLGQPIPIDDEDTASFCDRWATMLALMTKGDYDAARDKYQQLISQK